jgi:uncharacterized repeat protein (TIGR01451 family)
MKFSTLGAIALLVAAGSAFAGSTDRLPAGSTLDEKAVQPAAAPRTASITATVNYTANIPASPTFNRPSSCSNLSGIGTANGYHVQGFTVDMAGSYSMEVLSTTMPGGDSILILYQGPFNPASPLTNCIAYNDDIGGGNFLSRITTNLSAGTAYTLVTTSFDPGEVGTANNQITGPGNITLAGTGPSANLGLTKAAPNGVVNGGNYIYRLNASNAGPDNATSVVVTDTLPAGITYVSSTCGATASGQTVTWTIGALANGASASCDLTVNRASMTCSAVTNTATISGMPADPNPANNTGTHSNGGAQLIVDGSFEAANAPAWVQASSNFGTPLCDVGSCGTGNGTAGPRTGAQWMWFGGIASTEVGSAEQTVTIPTGANSLTFGYWLGTCAAGAGANDFIRLTIGGTEVWRRNASSPECGASGYSVATVDITSFATGASRIIRFESTSGTSGAGSNFHIDDVSLTSPPTCVAPPNADLGLTQTLNASTPQTIGSSVAIVLGVSNAGPGSASGVIATTVLPNRLTYVSNTCGATLSGSNVSWNIGTLANGASASCTINTTINSAGAISVSSSVSSSTSDPVPANNSATGSLTGAIALAIPSLDRWGLLLLVLSMLGLGGFFAVRRQG